MLRVASSFVRSISSSPSSSYSISILAPLPFLPLLSTFLAFEEEEEDDDESPDPPNLRLPSEQMVRIIITNINQKQYRKNSDSTCNIVANKSKRGRKFTFFETNYYEGK